MIFINKYLEKFDDEDPDYNPHDNDIFFLETNFIQHLIQTEPKW